MIDIYLNENGGTDKVYFMSLHDRITYRLNRVRLLSYQVDEQLTLARQSSHINQQRIHAAQARVDELLMTLWASTEEAEKYQPTADNGQQNKIEHLEKQIQERSQLLRQSAHDLKSNLGIAGVTADMLTVDQLDAHQLEILSMLKRNLRQANDLLIQLLNVTRFEAGEEQLQLTKFDVGQLLAGLVRNVWLVANQKGLWVRTNGTASLRIEGDSVRLYRIAQNIVLNAIKYTSVGGVTLSWGNESIPGRWYFSVTDTGPGMGSQQPSGEGIGLLIVKQLCELLEGQFSNRAVDGGGLEYRFSFPAQYTKRFISITKQAERQ